MYLKIFTQFTKPLATEILWINWPIDFKKKNLSIYLSVKENVAINTITNIKLMLFRWKIFIGFIWFPFKIRIKSLFNS